MKQIKQILLIFISTSRKILNGFDERKVIKQGDVDIEYGIIHGNSTIVFIKAGLLGSYRGYKNKYLKIAKRLNRNHRCTVITASNPNGYHDDFDSEMKFLKDYAYQYNLSDYQIYYMGNSITDAILFPCTAGAFAPLCRMIGQANRKYLQRIQ